LEDTTRNGDPTTGGKTTAVLIGHNRFTMTVLLVVDRVNSGGAICAMVWSTADDDPRLLESKEFKGPSAFKVWLAGIVTRYGRSSVTVNWSEALKGDDRLSAVVRECVELP
jgi:hypothetical protein